MLIQKVMFQGYGPFTEWEMPFWSAEHPERKVSVLIGENGAGKSAILDGMTTLLSWLAARIRSDKNSGSPIPELRIHNDMSTANLAIELEDAGRNYTWNIARTKAGKQKIYDTTLKDVSMLAAQYRSVLQNDDYASLPLIAYYPTERYVLDIPKKIRKKHEFKQINGYETALTKGIDFRCFFEWFRDREDVVNEGKISLDEISPYIDWRKYAESMHASGEKRSSPQSVFSFLQTEELEKADPLLSARVKYRDILLNDPQYLAVLHALKVFMPGYSQLRIQRKPRMRMVISKDNQELDILQLSQGEKSLLALVGDIARRLAMMNPGLPDPLQGEGIVLIDEVDLHLHPRWQRVIVRRLRETFPCCQFILSTHSPLVISDPNDIQVILLSNGQAKELPNLYGMDVEQVLLEVMGTKVRDPFLQNMLDDLMDAIQERKYDKARKLRRRLGHLVPPDHRELVRADIFLRRQEASDAKHH